MLKHNANLFPTAYASILQRIDAIQPVQYAKTRNYLDGAITYLSPYISRGVISLLSFLFGKTAKRG
jgi:deoxyribodipyrimidine photo-lyase